MHDIYRERYNIYIKYYLQFSMLDLQKAEEPDIKLPTSIGSQKKQGNSRKTSNSASLIMLKPLTVWIITNCDLQEMGIPDILTCLPRNLFVGQEAAVRTLHGIADWFTIGKGVPQGCILLLNLYAENIMRNARLDEAQAGIKTARKMSITSDMQMMLPFCQKSKRN